MRKKRTLFIALPIALVIGLVVGLFLQFNVSVKPNKGLVAISFGQPSYAATESLPPTGQVTWTNLSGSYLDIDDDPDSPNGDWADATDDALDTIAHVNFDTPMGNPTHGADLQEFKVYARKSASGGNPPDGIQISLYENGGLLVAGSLEAVTSETGVLYSFTWNANLLSNADGSEVECYVLGDACTGKPADRRSVDIDAVEWNVDYSAAPNITIDPTFYDFGTVVESTEPYTSTTYFLIDNTSGIQTDQTISVTTSTWSGGVTWTHSDMGTAGTNQAGLLANKGGTWGAGDVIVKYNTPLNYIAENQPANTDYQFGLKLIAPTAFTDGVEKAITVRVTAAAG